MADPTPQKGLPNTEWIELKNITNATLNLQGMRLAKPGSNASGPMPAFLLLPDSAVIVCTGSQVAAMSVFGKTISVTSFPSLANEGDLVYLQDANGNLLHSVEYSIAWYKNELKAEGGWSLEMIDTRFPCQGINNWTASTDAKGGTPGQPNAVAGNNPDATPPVLMSAFAEAPDRLLLRFNEALQPAAAANPARYTISNGIAALSASPLLPNYNTVALQLNSQLQPATIYQVTANNIADCAGNLETTVTARVGLASNCDSMDVIINEVLFNPLDFGSDYVELFNRSNKIINLQTLSLANRSSSSGVIGSIRNITTTPLLLFPGDYALATADTFATKDQYTVLHPDRMIAMASLPSYPNTSGWVVLLNEQGNIVDELPYDEKWHFALLDNPKGVALERINPDASTSAKDNWTSAAKTAGFGTPTSPNSQLRADLQPQGDITVNPPLFSPDNDGWEDFTLIQFRFPEPGYVANVTLHDAAGRPVRILQRNTTCAASGQWRWDGLNDKQQRVPAGTYIIYTDIFNLQGNKRRFKNSVVVARKF